MTETNTEGKESFPKIFHRNPSEKKQESSELPELLKVVLKQRRTKSRFFWDVLLSARALPLSEAPRSTENIASTVLSVLAIKEQRAHSNPIPNKNNK